MQYPHRAKMNSRWSHRVGPILGKNLAILVWVCNGGVQKFQPKFLSLRRCRFFELCFILGWSSELFSDVIALYENKIYPRDDYIASVSSCEILNSTSLFFPSHCSWDEVFFYQFVFIQIMYVPNLLGIFQIGLIFSCHLLKTIWIIFELDYGTKKSRLSGGTTPQKVFNVGFLWAGVCFENHRKDFL